MVQKITGEAPFQVLATNFSISPSLQNYVLQISADGTNYSDLFTVSAGQTKMVTNVANGSYYRMKNNASEVSINWRTQCNDGQGGGGGSYVLPPATEQTLGGIKVGSGLTVQADGTLSANGGSVDPTVVQELIDANNTKIEEGEIIAGMAKQLYSPDGVTSEGAFAYRTTAGDEDVSSGLAKLKKVEGNAIFPETVYNDSAVLMRGGEEVTGFTCDIATGDVQSIVWEEVQESTNFSSDYPNVKKARVECWEGTDGDAFRFTFGAGFYASIWCRSGVWQIFENAQATSNPYVFNIVYGGVVYGTMTASQDWSWVTAEVTGNTNITTIQCTSLTAQVCEVSVTGMVPNDIQLGEHTYTYGLDSWSPELPLAISNMEIGGEPYVGETDDELVITRSATKTGNVSYPAPSLFVALGLNSFTSNSDNIINFIAMEDYLLGGVNIDDDDYYVTQNSNYNIYAIKAVTGLENGYIVYHNEGSVISIAGVADAVDWDEITFATTIHTTKYDVVFPTAEFPYIVFSVKKGDETNVCVHPRWSGYMDESYEDYAESVLDISSFNTDYPLLSVGNVRNIWDFENSQLIQNIGVSTYSAQAVQDLIDGGKEIGVDFDFDENNIYEVLDEPIVTDITFENDYDANDFSVEYFVQDNDLISVPVYATTWYMNNLVDKLRRLKMDFVHLNDLSSEGEEGITYEYNGRLFKWVNGSGVCGEWIGCMQDANSKYNDSNNDMLSVFAYSYLPTGQTIICTLNYFNDPNAYVVYVPSEGVLKVYNDSGLTSLYKTISKGEINVQGNNRNNNRVWISWIEGEIQFRIESYAAIRNRFNPAVSTTHYEIAEKDYAHKVIWPNEQTDGIPIWNKEGIVIGRKTGYYQKTIYFNTTGYSNNTSFVTTGTNGGPTRMFVPQFGGNAGQVLTSAGNNAEPTWTTMIKAQQITSAAYEALVQAGTTDPNTLYLINDNA